MKRLVALLLVAVLACSLVGCDLGSSDKSDENAPLMTGGVSDTLTFDELEITVTKFVFQNTAEISAVLVRLSQGVSGARYI